MRLLRTMSAVAAAIFVATSVAFAWDGQAGFAIMSFGLVITLVALVLAARELEASEAAYGHEARRRVQAHEIMGRALDRLAPYCDPHPWNLDDAVHQIASRFCPLCGADHRGGPIPEDIADNYSSKHWSRRVAITDPDRDRVTQYRCPDCGGTWDRD